MVEVYLQSLFTTVLWIVSASTSRSGRRDSYLLTLTLNSINDFTQGSLAPTRTFSLAFNIKLALTLHPIHHSNSSHWMPVSVALAFSPQSIQDLKTAVDACTKPPTVGDCSSISSSRLVRTSLHVACRKSSGQTQLERISGQNFAKLDKKNCLNMQHIVSKTKIIKQKQAKQKSVSVVNLKTIMYAWTS